MSVEAIAAVLNHSRAKGTAKLVLIGIANHAGDGGAYPSVGTLARYANVDLRNAQRAIDKLEELGEVSIEYRAGGNRETPEHERTNRYTILVSCPPTCDRSLQHRTGTPVALVPPPGDSAMGSPGGAGATSPVADPPGPPVAQAPPEPSLEPETPQTPRQRGAGCARHQTSTANCRGCGTTNRQIAEQTAREAAERRRLEEQARWAHETEAAKARAVPMPPEIRRQLRSRS